MAGPGRVRWSGTSGSVGRALSAGGGMGEGGVVVGGDGVGSVGSGAGTSW